MGISGWRQGWLLGPGPGWATLRSAQLHLLPANKEELSGIVKINGNLGCGDHVLMEFMIQKGERKASSRVQIMHLRKADFGLFRKLVGGTAWESQRSPENLTGLEGQNVPSTRIFNSGA